MYPLAPLLVGVGRNSSMFAVVYIENGEATVRQYHSAGEAMACYQHALDEVHWGVLDAVYLGSIELITAQ